MRGILLLLSSFCICALAISQNSKKLKFTDRRDVYVYNTFNDTLYFAPLVKPNQPKIIRFTIIDSIQIDGKGAKELIFQLSESYSENMAAQTFNHQDSTNFEVIEIWNMDEKKNLFRAITHFDTDYNHWEEFRSSENASGGGSYNYTFKMDKPEQITLADFTYEVIPDGMTIYSKEKESQRNQFRPDHEMGTYVYDKVKEEFVLE